MPPEPLPWDRKDFFKERKHERSDSSSLGFAPRWRDSSSSHYGSSREFPRWGGSNEFRRPPGHGKQGGWHLFAEDSGHGYAPYRSGDKILEDENFRPSVSRADGKYGRSSRESRGYRDWKGHSSDMSNGSPSMSGRLHDANNDQRSVDDVLAYPSSHPPHSDFVNTWDQLHFKDHDDNIKTGGINGLGTGQRGDKENSLDWKPLKWDRSASLSSRGSGFSHSSSSKSLGGADSSEGKTELQPKNATPIQSPSGDAAACVTSAALSEETTSRKKPRLGWGEGLAKYEKKKVEGPEMTVNKDANTVSENNAELFSQSLNVADKNHRVFGSSDCASPATPSSVACSSSPGLEDKSFGKALNVDNDTSNLCGSPSIESQAQSQLEGSSFNLEKLDISSIANLGSSLIELLQADYPSSLDSSFVRSTALNKLLVWKGDISKLLEVTESGIDSLENELKSLKCESGIVYPCVEASSSFTVEGDTKPFDGRMVPSNNITRPSPLEVSCGDDLMGVVPVSNGALDENHVGVKDDDIDSPGTATSKFVEPVRLMKAVSSSYIVGQDECPGDLDAFQSSNTESKCSVPCGNKDETVLPDGRVSMLAECNISPCSGDMSLCMDGEDTLFSAILASNKEFAREASEVFDKLLPKDHKIDFSGVITAPSWNNDALVKEKFAMRKRFLRFKERVVTLKFKAFQHLWKEDVRLLSIRKYRAKSQKKFEFSLRTAHTGYQKHRSSNRSRHSSPAGNVTLNPTADMLNFTSKLIPVSQAKLYRDTLKMPALILDEKEKSFSRFISNNGLVEDPWAVEKERTMINPWSTEERETFMDKLATYGKDFQKIASFLDHKTTADCVEFYYKNHKSDCFEKDKRGKRSKSSTNYLVSLGKKWNREMNAASLDILGAASVMAADADNAMRSRQMRCGRIILGGYKRPKTSRPRDGILERSSNILGSERETVAADVLAGICGSVSSEAMSSCITTSVDPGEGYREQMCQNIDSSMKRPWVADFAHSIDEETCSDESCGEMDPADWTDEEKSRFMQAVSSYGKDFAMISQFVRTRSRDQCKVFFSKARKCLGLDQMHPGHGHLGTPKSDDVNGGGSDTDGAEYGSIICSDKLGSKMVEDSSLFVNNAKQDESDAGERMNLSSELNRSKADSPTGLSGRRDCNAVETSVSGSCRMEQRPDQVAYGDSTLGNGIHQMESVQEKSSIESISMETDKDQVTEEGTSIAESMSVDVINPVTSIPTAMIEAKDAAEVSGTGIGSDVEGRELMMPENKSNSRIGLIQDSITMGTSNPSDTNSCTSFSFPTANMHQVSMKLECVGNPSIISLQQENNLGTANSELHNSSAILYDGELCNQEISQSTLDLKEGRNKQGHNSVSRDDDFQHLSGHSLLNCEGSPQILRGFPVQISTKKEMNGDMSCKPLSEVPSLSTSERNAICQFVSQDCYLRKCSSLNAPCSVPELPVQLHHNDQTNGHRRDSSQGSSDSEKPSRNGDVKLFGKILSNPSSLQNPNGSAHESDEKGAHHSKPSNKSAVLKFSGHQSADGNSTLMKFDCNNYLGLDNVPMRSYGFWDGNRIQTGLPSMPDSSLLLAKYPAAFSNYHATSSKMEQQTLQAAAKNNEHSLNGLSVFPPREMNVSNGVMDYQMYRSHDSPKVQPFTLDMKQKMQPFMADAKQRQEMISEMQKRNGFEAISSLQQQGRGMTAMNVVGRGGGGGGGGGGGMLVGGVCAAGGVSDPVQAIKMHFAKSDQYSGGQNGTIVREEESWRGNGGDMGR